MVMSTSCTPDAVTAALPDDRSAAKKYQLIQAIAPTAPAITSQSVTDIALPRSLGLRAVTGVFHGEHDLLGRDLFGLIAHPCGADADLLHCDPRQFPQCLIHGSQ